MHEPELHLATYSPVVQELLQPPHSMPLGPGKPDPQVRPRLAQLSHSVLAGGKSIVDPGMLNGCLAGLWLWFDFLDESHAISQQLETPLGSYWHGIMHRREMDFSNAKYWFRRVGGHPVGEELVRVLKSASDKSDVATLVPGSRWDPARFVDQCELALQGRDASLQRTCQQIASLEWQLLFDYGWRAAFGGGDASR